MLLDEPTLGLAPIIAVQIFQLLRRLVEERLTLLLAEQDVRQTLNVADFAYVIGTAVSPRRGRLERSPTIHASSKPIWDSEHGHPVPNPRQTDACIGYLRHGPLVLFMHGIDTPKPSCTSSLIRVPRSLANR
jgi:energy-coupling factor transporter ATP-binding protein EcfA2